MSERRFPRAGYGEDLPDLLLHHARLDGPSSEGRTRALSRIMAAGAVGSGLGLLAASGASQGATASVAKVGTFAVAKWIVIGATAGAAMLGAREVVERAVSPGREPVSTVVRNARAPEEKEARSHLPVTSSTAQPRTPASEPTGIDPASPAPASQPRAGAQTEIPGARRGPLTEAEPRAKVPPAMGTAEAPGVEAASPSLSRELELLERTRVQLARRSPWAAVDTLESYQALFPAGAMQTEAAALRVEALAAAGRRQEAIASSRAFLAAYPQSPLAGRVRAILSKLEETSPRR